MDIKCPFIYKLFLFGKKITLCWSCDSPQQCIIIVPLILFSALVVSVVLRVTVGSSHSPLLRELKITKHVMSLTFPNICSTPKCELMRLLLHLFKFVPDIAKLTLKPKETRSSVPSSLFLRVTWHNQCLFSCCRFLSFFTLSMSQKCKRRKAAESKKWLSFIERC